MLTLQGLKEKQPFFLYKTRHHVKKYTVSPGLEMSFTALLQISYCEFAYTYMSSVEVLGPAHILPRIGKAASDWYHIPD